MRKIKVMLVTVIFMACACGGSEVPQFIEPAPAPESDPESEPQAEPAPVPESDPESEPQAEPAPAFESKLAKEGGLVPYGKDPNSKIRVMLFTVFDELSGSFYWQVEKDLLDLAEEGKLVMHARSMLIYNENIEMREAVNNALFCAQEQGYYWAMRKALFNNMIWGYFLKDKYYLDTVLGSWAYYLGLNEEKFVQCQQEKKYAGEVNSDLSWIYKYNISGYPSMVFEMPLTEKRQEIIEGLKMNMPMVVSYFVDGQRLVVKFEGHPGSVWEGLKSLLL